jgi:hypothetical protein
MTQVHLPNFANPRVARRLAGQNIGHGTMEVEQATDFLAAILDDRDPVIGPQEAADSTLPLICALQSANAGGGLVRVPDLA